MRKVMFLLMCFVMMFGSINVFSVAQYSTNISGDITLEFDDQWTPSFDIGIQHMLLPPDRPYMEINANIHLKGNTNAQRLMIQSASYPNLSQQILVDGNGNFDQEVKVVLSAFSLANSPSVDFSAYVIAYKGDNLVKVKIGKGELKTDLLTEFNELLNDDEIDSTEIALIKRSFVFNLVEDFEKIPEQDSINTYIYHEWYLDKVVFEKDIMPIIAQSHLRLHTEGDKVTYDIDNYSKILNYENITNKKMDLDKIYDFEGSVPSYVSSDHVAQGIVKIYKGNREVEFKSSLRGRRNGNAIKGDVNGDGDINSTDYSMLKRYVLGNIMRFPLAYSFYCSDVNNDKVLDTLDCVIIRRYLLGVSSVLTQ